MADVLYNLVFLPKGSTIPCGGTIDVPPEKVSVRAFHTENGALHYVTELVSLKGLSLSETDIYIHEVGKADQVSVKINAHCQLK